MALIPGQKLRREVHAKLRSPRLMSVLIDGTSTAKAEITTIAVPATASATQGDYIVLTNGSGVKFAIWLDIDADGTEPTGDDYLEVLEANRKVASIATLGTASDNAAIVAAIVCSGITLADAGSGNVTATNTVKAVAAATVRHNEDDSGNGSFTLTRTQTGTATSTSLSGEGKFDATLADGSNDGEYTLTFREPLGRAPIVVATPVAASDVIAVVTAVSLTACTIKCFDATDGTTAKDSNLHVLILGSEVQDVI